MPTTTKFNELRAKMRPEASAEGRRLADKDLKEMPLHELRRRPPPDTATTRSVPAHDAASGFATGVTHGCLPLYARKLC